MEKSGSSASTEPPLRPPEVVLSLPDAESVIDLSELTDFEEPPLVTSDDEFDGNESQQLQRVVFLEDAVKAYARSTRTKEMLLELPEQIACAERIQAGLAAANAELIADGKKAENELIEANLRLVMSIASEFRHRQWPTLEFGDYIQIGNLKLMEIVQKYDPTKGIKFATFASPRIRGAMWRASIELGPAIRVAEGAVDKQVALDRARDELHSTLRREPTPQEIARRAGLSERWLRTLALVRSQAATSHNTPLGEGGDELASTVSQDTFMPPDEAYATAYATRHHPALLKQALGRLCELLDVKRMTAFLNELIPDDSDTKASTAELSKQLELSMSSVITQRRETLEMLAHPSVSGELLVSEVPDWDARPVCLDLSPVIFFPRMEMITRQSGRASGIRAAEETAKAICVGCKVRQACLSRAVKIKPKHGVWGGVTANDIRAMQGQ